jgi:hypothetical protein
LQNITSVVFHWGGVVIHSKFGSENTCTKSLLLELMWIKKE